MTTGVPTGADESEQGRRPGGARSAQDDAMGPHERGREAEAWRAARRSQESRPVTSEVLVDVGLLKSEIEEAHTSVSREPERDFIFPTGRAWAETPRTRAPQRTATPRSRRSTSSTTRPVRRPTRVGRADTETGWLPNEIALDPKGYVLTGSEVRAAGRWDLERDPYLLETSVPGIFACGDVRFSPVKRVAAAVGEGSMAIAFVHQYLRDAESHSESA